MNRPALILGLIAACAAVGGGCFATGGGPSAEVVSQQFIGTFTGASCGQDAHSKEEKGSTSIAPIHWCEDISDDPAGITSKCVSANKGKSCLVDAGDEGTFRVEVVADPNGCFQPTDLKVIERPPKGSALAALLGRPGVSSGAALAELWSQGRRC